MLISDEGLRAMYPGGRADAAARRLSRLWAAVFRLGLMPKRWVTLEVAGRRSGLITRFPLGMADLNGEWYLVSMLGERCNWVQNVRAAGGRATLRHRRATPCRLVEVPVGERAPIIRRYLARAAGTRRWRTSRRSPRAIRCSAWSRPRHRDAARGSGPLGLLGSGLLGSGLLGSGLLGSGPLGSGLPGRGATGGDGPSRAWPRW
jgi:hypothetical protein